MNLYSRNSGWCSLVAVLAIPALLLSLTSQQVTSLVISGQHGQATVVQVQGRNYVEVEGLARIANGTISFNGNQIVLTLPGSAGSAQPALAPALGFSIEFKTAGVEVMAEIREWHAALRTAIEQGVPLNERWLGPYRTQANRALQLASVAIRTDSDKNAYPFVVNVFNNMNTLTNRYLQMTNRMNYIRRNSLQSDPTDQKIVTCTRSLASMIAINQFIDDGSCR
jgi:hypothetical protein